MRLVVVLLGALALQACDRGLFLQRTTFPTYRYRLLVAVNTPEGVKIGSNVIEVKTRRATGFGMSDLFVTRRIIAGDAVTVDLGQRGKMFVLLRHSTDQSWPGDIMRHFIDLPLANSPEVETREEIERILEINGPQRINPREIDSIYRDNNLPDFVAFGNTADIRTIRWLPWDKLDSAFGSGVSLRAVTVQITKDPVVHNITSSLPWVGDDDQYRRVMDLTPPGSRLQFLSETDFTRGS